MRKHVNNRPWDTEEGVQILFDRIISAMNYK